MELLCLYGSCPDPLHLGHVVSPCPSHIKHVLPSASVPDPKHFGQVMRPLPPHIVQFFGNRCHPEF